MNPDGSTTLSGKSTAEGGRTEFYGATLSLAAGTYTLGGATGAGGAGLLAKVAHAGGAASYHTAGGDAGHVTFEVGATDSVRCAAYKDGSSDADATLWPMLAAGSVPAEYEAYDMRGPSRNILRYGPADITGAYGSITVTVNADGSLHCKGEATGVGTLVRWALDPATVQGRTVTVSQTGADGSKFLVGIFGNKTGGGAFNLYNTGSLACPDSIGDVSFLVYARKAGAFEFDLKAQLELGTAATAWERPDDVGWGGVVPDVNLWRETPGVTSNGVTFAVGEMGEVKVSGTAAAAGVSQTVSGFAPLAAGTYTLSGGSMSDDIGVKVWVKAADKDMYPRAPSTFTVGEGATYATYVDVERGATVDKTVWPMLVAGTEAKPYVPYERGGVPRNLVAGFSDMGSFKSVAGGWQQLADGWARISLDNSAGVSTMYANFWPAALDEVPATATALLEVRGLAGDMGVYAASPGTASSMPQLDVERVELLKTDGSLRQALVASGADSPVCSIRPFAFVGAGKTGSCEARISLYEGDYEGPYLPYRTE